MNTDHETMESGLEKPASKSQIQRRLDAQIDTKWADLILLGCFFCSGLIDSMAFNMYACFVSMQTGMLQLYQSIHENLLKPARQHNLRWTWCQRTTRLSASILMGKVSGSDCVLCIRRTVLLDISSIFWPSEAMGVGFILCNPGVSHRCCCHYHYDSSHTE